MSDKVFFRLAMRHEGIWWNAYLAQTDSMVGANLIGSIRITLVKDEEAKAAFLSAMQVAMTVAAKAATGVDLTWPEAPKPAPESERSGHS